MHLKIISWNLNHRTGEREISPRVVDAFEKIGADTIVLNEYVDGKSRKSFKKQLRELGYHISVSEMNNPVIKRFNQILIASKHRYKTEIVNFDTLDSHAFSNFLMVKFEEGLMLAGLRAPFYKTSWEQKAWWNEILKITSTNKGAPMMFIGDFNCDPEKGRRIKLEVIDRMKKNNFTFNIPKGKWSYISNSGKVSKIDHILASSFLEIKESKYIYHIDDIVLTGDIDEKPLSDHALLFCELYLK